MNALEAPIPTAELPGNRLMESSAEYLTDSELLALILRRGSVPSALSLSRKLLSQYGSMKELAQVSSRELMRIKGIGKTLACAIIAALEIARRLNADTQGERPKFTSPADVSRHFSGIFQGRQQEEFHVCLLDTKRRLLRSEKVTVGLLDRAQIHPREVFRPAIREACSCIVLVHNHPSGDPTPSAADIASTKSLVSAGKIIGIEAIDHVIIGQRSATNPKDYLSFREEGLI